MGEGTPRRRKAGSRRAARALIATVLCLLCLPASAFAGQDDIYAGVLDYAGAYGPRHSLTSVWATWFSLNLACMNALNADGTGWAGDTFCADGVDQNVGHPYCGCKLRYGFGRSGYSGTYSNGYWRQFW